MDDAWSLLWLLGQFACAIALMAGAVLVFFETDFMLERPPASLTEADPQEAVAPVDLHKAA
jgi:hypothetical protein